MKTIFLALGSNIGDSRAHIEKAIELLSESLSVITRAPIYISKAVGYTDQPNFLNTALRGQTNLSPNALLHLIKRIEQKVGRIQRFDGGPREIDIDIIFYVNYVIEGSALAIPHLRFRERDFVLRPLNDLDPKYIDPVTKLSVKDLLDKLPESERSIL